MKELDGFVPWLPRLTALTAFALGLAILWELPHYETLVGLPQRGQNRIWLLRVLWAKTLLPVAAAFLACAAFHCSRYRRSASQAFWAATLLALIWLLGDLWCQLRYGAEASSYLPFVVAALRGGAAERHVQWVGDPSVVAASLFAWLALGALAIACLRVASRFGWATLAARTPRLTGDRAARVLVGSWCVAVLAASFGIQQLEPRPVRESLASYLPFPFGWPFDRIVNGGASAACEGPDVLGVVPYSWEGGHQPELVLRNSCPGVLSLDGWSSET